MPLKAESIQAGKCYKTRASENYKVLSITRGIDTGVEAFADAVYKEVPCPDKFGTVGVMNTPGSRQD
jgi:hypothetical protein